MIPAFLLLLSVAMTYASFQHTDPPVRGHALRITATLCAAAATVLFYIKGL